MAVTRLAIASALLLATSVTLRAEPSGALVDTVPSITVDGEAQREVAPDLATVTLGVVTDRATASQASADNAQAAAAVVATARAAGLGDAYIRTTGIGLAAVTDGRDSSKIKTFRASNQVSLRMRDLGKVGPLVGQLAAQGANDIDGIAFSVENPQPILDDLRGDATRDASRKAEIYAKAAGVKLGRILRIAPDAAGLPVPMPRAYKLRMAADAPAPPVEAGTEALRAHVQVTWELVP